jgi:hypothetical protein
MDGEGSPVTEEVYRTGLPAKALQDLVDVAHRTLLQVHSSRGRRRIALWLSPQGLRSAVCIKKPNKP